MRRGYTVSHEDCTKFWALKRHFQVKYLCFKNIAQELRSWQFDWYLTLVDMPCKDQEKCQVKMKYYQFRNIFIAKRCASFTSETKHGFETTKIHISMVEFIILVVVFITCLPATTTRSLVVFKKVHKTMFEGKQRPFSTPCVDI